MSFIYNEIITRYCMLFVIVSAQYICLFQNKMTTTAIVTMKEFMSVWFVVTSLMVHTTSLNLSIQKSQFLTFIFFQRFYMFNQREIKTRNKCFYSEIYPDASCSMRRQTNTISHYSVENNRSSFDRLLDNYFNFM